MPADNRRFTGPEDSEDYHLYIKTKKNNKKSVCSTGREESRKWDEQRKIYMKTGVTSRVKGSAYLEAGRTKVLVSVYEPREIPRLSEFTANGELHCEFRFAPFSRGSRRNLQIQADEKDLSLTMKRALEPAVCRGEFPNCQVDIYVLVIDDDGSSFSTAVTAAGIALADAGVPMYDTVGAVTLGIQGKSLFLDPCLSEEEHCMNFLGSEHSDSGLITMVYLSTLGQISNTTLTGSLSMDRLLENLELLSNRCAQVAELSCQRLKKDVLKKCAEEKEDSEKVEAETVACGS